MTPPSLLARQTDNDVHTVILLPFSCCCPDRHIAETIAASCARRKRKKRGALIVAVWCFVASSSHPPTHHQPIKILLKWRQDGGEAATPAIAIGTAVAGFFSLENHYIEHLPITNHCFLFLYFFWCCLSTKLFPFIFYSPRQAEEVMVVMPLLLLPIKTLNLPERLERAAAAATQKLKRKNSSSCSACVVVIIIARCTQGVCCTKTA